MRGSELIKSGREPAQPAGVRAVGKCADKAQVLDRKLPKQFGKLRAFGFVRLFAELLPTVRRREKPQMVGATCVVSIAIELPRLLWSEGPNSQPGNRGEYERHVPLVVSPRKEVR